MPRGRGHVFVAATTEIHDDDFIALHFRSHLRDVRDGMGAFECWDDALEFRQILKALQRFTVGGEGVFHAALVMKHRVLGADCRVVETGADRVREINLAIGIRQQPGLRALQDTELLALELDLSDPATQAALARTPRLAKPLTAALQARLAAQMRAACVPARVLAGLHPLLQLSHLTVLTGRWDGFDAAFGQEMQLLAFAHSRGRPVVALERVEDQLQALIPSDTAAVQRSIEDGLAQLEQGSVRGPMRRLALAWARGDLSDLQNYEQWCDCVHSEDERRWLRRLNDERNPQLAQRIAALHGQGTRVLAAVGALHMSGPQALPLLLAQDGFEVTRITAKR